MQTFKTKAVLICFLLTHGSSVGRFGNIAIVLLPWGTNMHCASQYASVGQYTVLGSFLHTGLQNQKNSTDVRGSGHKEKNAIRSCPERVNVPKSLILKG